MRSRLFIVVLILSICMGVSVQADDYVDDVYYWGDPYTASDDYATDNQTNTEQEYEEEEEETTDTPELLLYTYQTDAYNPGEFTHAEITFVEDSTLNQTTQVRAIIHRY